MNQPHSTDTIRSYTSRRWVLVAGTGIPEKIIPSEKLAASSIGKTLAEYGYGLVSGGWPGVDEIVTKSFIEQLRSESLDPDDYLIQVVSEDSQLRYDEGHIVYVPSGGREWLEPQKYADAVIIIGGKGGAYVTWLGALHDGLPRFSLKETKGDAEKTFNDTIKYWELMPVPGVSQAQYKELERFIKTDSDANWLANYLVGKLLSPSLNAVDAVESRNTLTAKSIFISYSRRIRTLLRPSERRGLISTWIDEDIEKGKPWELQIQNRLKEANYGLILVSNNLLKSDYVKKTEIPAFKTRLDSENSDFRLFWALLEPCNWKSVPELKEVQAIGDFDTAISESETDADKQIRLIEIVEEIVKAMSKDIVITSLG
jgi:hypothetical protein